MTTLRALFQLDPDVTFLNHGSFGATPKPVFEVYQAWQRRLERQPVRFLGRELPALLAEARSALGAYIHADAEDVVFIPNATFGINVVARSLSLGPGDEVLTTDHEYGACDNVWRYLAQKQGFLYKPQEISLPIESAETIMNQFWQGVTPQTKVIFMSHISSTTAVVMPVQAICAKAREAGIITVIDGAHTIGQIALNMSEIGADFYVANAHKWLCSPKGSAFLYVSKKYQATLEPLVISWGWGGNPAFSFGSKLLDYLQWMGTTDQSAYLSVPAAIAFQATHKWPMVRERCHRLLRQGLQELQSITKMVPIYPQRGRFYWQMGVAPLPMSTDVLALKTALYEQYHIEVPCITWQGQPFIRISVQGYNTQTDMEKLLAAITVLTR